MSEHKILEETQSYIEKMEAVEKDRKESGGSTTLDVQSEVNIVVDQYKEPVPDSVCYTVKAGEVLEDETEPAGGAEELAAEVTDALVLTVDAGEVVAEEIIQPVLENDVVEEIHNLVASEIKADTEALEDVKDDAAAKEDVAATENDVSTEDAAEKASLYEYSVTEDAASSVVLGSKTTDEYYRQNGFTEEYAKSDGSSDTVVGETAEDRIASLHEVASDLEDQDANSSSPRLSRSASIRSEIRSNGIESPAVSRSGSIKSTAVSRSASIKSTALSRSASIKSTALSRSASIRSEAPAKDHEESTLSRSASIKSTTSSKRASIKAALLSHSASIKSEAQEKVINEDASSVHKEKVPSRSASIKSTASSRRASIKSTTNGGSTEAEFEERVKKNISQYKNEKSMSNVEVLKNLEKEEGEDQPSVKKLLAWAKGTRKAKTETMVVRQKKHEDKIRQAVDIGGVNLVLAEKKTVVKEGVLEKEKMSAAKVEQESAVDRNLVQRIARSSLAVDVNMASIIVTTKAPNCHMVGFETVDTKQKGSWTVIQKSADVDSKDVLVRSDLAAKIMSSVGVTRAEHKLPFFPLIFSDNKISVFDNDPLYTSLPSDRQLDEVHLKVVMKSLARLHAISFIFFKRSADENSKAFLSDSSFTEENRATTTKLLETRLDRVLSTLAAEGCTEEEIKMVKTLKSSLFNIFKEAASSNSLLPVLCHGEPTPANIKFKYAADGLPLDARFVNLEKCRFGSGVNDIHLFINSSGNNTAREDFLLRFVYYEALVSLLKVYGEKNVFSFDELKSEFVQKRLYGYIQSSFILAEGPETAHAPKKAVSAPAVQSQQGTKAVESKILGKFFPGRSKVAAVAKFNQVEKGSVREKEDVGSRARDMEDVGARVRDIIMKAIKV